MSDRDVVGRITDWSDGSVRPIRPSQCGSCRNLVNDLLWTCRAYPSGIPAAILSGRYDHRKPFLGDGGIRYEPKEE